MDTMSSESTRASPTTLATSQEIRDRGSTFVGYVYRAGTADDARVTLRHHAEHKHKHKDGTEVYAIAAWRCMVVRPGRTGLGGPEEFVVEEGCEDGGERWAGGRVLGVMKREGVIDAVVVVCRWWVIIVRVLPHRGLRTYSWHTLSGSVGRCWDRSGSPISRPVLARCVAGSKRWRRWRSAFGR